MDAIRTTNLVKKYGEKLAVENLSLTVRAGTMFGFLGPNGSGKSTTIGCMTGLLDATSGEIELLGQRFNPDNAAIKRRIGVMPETLGLFEPLYAHEFLAFVARMFGLDEAKMGKTINDFLHETATIREVEGADLAASLLQEHGFRQPTLTGSGRPSRCTPRSASPTGEDC